ncbi:MULTISPECIES: M20/M25/M40 family metallo-hydrolase [unclassified Microbacterium]|uniref:M20/M25/M40 family metallo-hydrolase n=1 Tax=unclassified Microbacterium TaxID=2609290 RepID=UPI00217F0A9D|nr:MULTISPECIES: M20/M25/M40 family metallo-hydrolase [unclassified Microbacterium]
MTTSAPAPEPDLRSEDILALVRELVHHESPSRDAAASAALADDLAGRFEALGGTVERVASAAGTHLVVHVAGIGDPLLLVGHTDTVWPVGTIERELPWSHDGDIVRGPGTYDMKAGIVVVLGALSRLRGIAPQKRRAVRIVLVCDEEIGSPESTPHLREWARGTAGAIGFESPHPDGALKVGRRGSTRMRLSVHGREAHAALDPEKGISAVDELVDQLLRVRQITSDPTLPGPVLCNVGRISGGSRTNVVPADASAEVGLRFTDRVTEERVLAALTGLLPVREGARLTAEVLSSRPAWVPSAADATLLAQVTEAGARIRQQITARPAAGAGDTNLLGSLGIPTVDGFGPRGGGAHARDEHFRLSSLHERIDLLCALLTTPDL